MARVGLFRLERWVPELGSLVGLTWKGRTMDVEYGWSTGLRQIMTRGGNHCKKGDRMGYDSTHLALPQRSEYNEYILHCNHLSFPRTAFQPCQPVYTALSWGTIPMWCNFHVLRKIQEFMSPLNILSSSTLSPST